MKPISDIAIPTVPPIPGTARKYRKRPIVIEATQWFTNGDHPEDGAAREHPDTREGEVVRYYRRPPLPGYGLCEVCKLTMYKHGWVDTLEGGHTVCPGDWIITGVAGEHYPCKPDIFEKTYQPVEEQDDGKA